MNTLKKTLMAATMVVTLGMTTSCGNKENSQVFVAGTPYTLIALDILEFDKEYTVEFGCEGNPTTYWDFVKSPEASDHGKSHTYNEMNRAPVILIEGNISSLWFCDEKGVPLANGNAKIQLVVFSNTITNIREYACYGLELDGAYIPASVKTIGKYAFLPYNPEMFFCEPPARPSGWDVYWCTIGELNRIVTWGFSYYIDEETGEKYVLIADDDLNTAFYQGSIFPPSSGALVIPKTLKVNNRDFTIVTIDSIGNARNIESLTIPDSVLSIGASVFSGCTKLTDVKFEGDFVYLQMGDYVFWNCTKLETITLPEGLINIPAYAFEDCYELKYVKIPSSVERVNHSVLQFASKETELEIDLTAFKDPTKIAECSSSFISSCAATKITFKIDSGLKEKNFTDKGWPAASSGTPTIEWVKDSSLA